MNISLSWDEKWTWNHPDFYIFFVSFERFDEMQLPVECVGGVWSVVGLGWQGCRGPDSCFDTRQTHSSRDAPPCTSVTNVDVSCLTCDRRLEETSRTERLHSRIGFSPGACILGETGLD